MSNPAREFVAPESMQYRIKLGRHIASGLSGFIAGAIFASIIWLAAILLIQIYG